MKICFLAAGNSIHSYRWIKFFSKEGHHVYWITPFYPSSFFEEKISLIKLGRSNNTILHKIINILEAKKEIKKIQPDILHAHYAGYYGLIGALSGMRPFVLTVWGSDVLFAGKSILKGPLIRLVLKRATLITCDAYHMQKQISVMGIPLDKIHIINFGTDTEKFKPGYNTSELRNRLKLSDAPVVISLRSLEPVYDVITFIRSIPVVLKKAPDTQFIIAGKGSEEVKLESLANSLNISKKVKFVGQVQNDILPEYLNLSDIYVSTSLSDAGISASTSEAMACELPVVITDSGENKLWVMDGKGGFIVPIRSPITLAEKILYLLENEPMRKTFGATNRNTITEKNNYFKEMEKMEALYNHILKNKQTVIS
jgi:glycosyltransferase involved in cell wall biosynthesis